MTTKIPTASVFQMIRNLNIPQTPENRARQIASKRGYRCIAMEPETWSNGVCGIRGIDALMDVMNNLK